MALKLLHGVHAPHRKNTADMAAVTMDCPASVTIPMSMHIGAPAKPLVKVGDTVTVGQLIAEAGGFVSSPIHASVSGKVKKIDEIMTSSGRKTQAVTIESDGLMTPCPDLQPPVINDTADFLKAVSASGIVGLGGAGFPTHVKLTVKDLSKIEAIIVNGAECEPYITSDTRTMLDQTDLMFEGAHLLQKYLEAKRIIFAVENNKPQCIAKLEAQCKKEQGMEVAALPAMYPQGGEKVTVYHTTGRVVPEGKLPLDAGAIVINCTTLASIANYVKTGMPLVAKCVTVDGSAVKEPKNVIVPIGTSMEDVFNFCGGFKADPRKVLYGGPMMGIAVPDLNQPVMKNTNAILAFAEDGAVLPEPTACIKCGRCIAHCPLKLMPAEIESAFERGDVEGLAELKVNICMECGCCSFICPARRPLVQTNKLAKGQVMAYLKAKQEKEAAKV
ncbi:MAG: electron transport complex subunit RsxC [Oscillospiraceae bacterium]|nr:electron transport complex subunit RsxC [Oscillospiraceae bacterium]